MVGINLTVSLRDDELKKIEAYMAEFAMKRHEVVKLAIRSFLFPDEMEHPLNGVKGHVDDSFLMGPKGKKERERIQSLREKGLHNVNLSPPPVVIFKSEEDLAKEEEEERAKKAAAEKMAKARAEANRWIDENVLGRKAAE